ncbi:MAG: DinB family protein [Myxococcota bacterium]
MGIKAWALEMARYNRWQDECLYELCAGMSDDARKQDRGMFFGSIHDTLDHILALDKALLDFCVTGTPPSSLDFGTVVHTDFGELRSVQAAFDVGLEALLAAQPEPWLDDTLTFASERAGGTRSLPRWFYWAQLFNHATHHRSQVTAALHKLGIDYGITDMPYNPYSPS